MPPDDALIADLLNPARSLDQVAASRGTTPAALSLLLTTRPDLSARLADLESLAAQRIRLIAAQALPSVATLLQRIILDFLERPRATGDHAPQLVSPAPSRDTPTTAAPSPAAPTAPAAPDAITLRRAETARRAAATLLRLASFFPARTAPHGPSQLPRDRTDSARFPGRADPVPPHSLHHPHRPDHPHHIAPPTPPTGAPPATPGAPAPHRAAKERTPPLSGPHPRSASQHSNPIARARQPPRGEAPHQRRRPPRPVAILPSRIRTLDAPRARRYGDTAIAGSGCSRAEREVR